MENAVEEEEEDVEDEPGGGEKFVFVRVFILQGGDRTKGNHQRQDEARFLVGYEGKQSQGNYQTADKAKLQQFCISNPVSKFFNKPVR